MVSLIEGIEFKQENEMTMVSLSLKDDPKNVFSV